LSPGGGRWPPISVPEPTTLSPVISTNSLTPCRLRALKARCSRNACALCAIGRAHPNDRNEILYLQRPHRSDGAIIRILQLVLNMTAAQLLNRVLLLYSQPPCKTLKTDSAPEVLKKRGRIKTWRAFRASDAPRPESLLNCRHSIASRGGSSGGPRVAPPTQTDRY